jgi:hypothetical protein
MNQATPCVLFEQTIQKLLDGDRCALSPELELHRSGCPECRAHHQAALDLKRGLDHWPAPPLPNMSDRVVIAVLSDAVTMDGVQRRVRRNLLLALAASVLLALGGVWVLSENGPVQKFISARWGSVPAPKVEIPAEAVKDRVPETPRSLRDSLEEAGSAVASLTRRTADETVTPTRKILASQMEAPSFVTIEELPKAMDPAAQSLQEVRQGAAAGFQPVASSARRAVSMFLREVPAADGEP